VKGTLWGWIIRDCLLVILGVGRVVTKKGVVCLTNVYIGCRAQNAPLQETPLLPNRSKAINMHQDGFSA
jgi:hypothetical protein